MREILFRGIPKTETNYHLLSSIWKKQSKNGWVYGSLIIAKDKYYICVSALCRVNSFVNNGITSMVEVIPETVGQYTGLTDKNGKKIFEGDIVAGALHWQERRKNGIVAFRNGSFGLLWYRGEIEQFNPFTSMCNVEYEVIGNVQENPELMRGEEE